MSEHILNHEKAILDKAWKELETAYVSGSKRNLEYAEHLAELEDILCKWLEISLPQAVLLQIYRYFLQIVASLAQGHRQHAQTQRAFLIHKAVGFGSVEQEVIETSHMILSSMENGQKALAKRLAEEIEPKAQEHARQNAHIQSEMNVIRETLEKYK